MSNPIDILGSDRELAAKRFESSVMKSFRMSTIFYDGGGRFGLYRNVAGVGDQVHFNMIGTTPESEYHQPGTRLEGQDQPYKRISIGVDDIVVQHRSLRGDHNILSHFDAQISQGQEMGHGLALDFDKKFACKAIQAARTAADPGFHQGGTVVSRVGGGSDISAAYPMTTQGATNLYDDMLEASYLMDRKNVPSEGRVAVITPYARAVLLNRSDIWSRDWQPQGTNDLLSRTLGMVAGFQIVVYNGIPDEYIVNIGPDGNESKYDVDCRYTAGNVANGTGEPIALLFAPPLGESAAVGVATAQDFTTWMNYEERENVLFMKAQQFFGVDVLHPEFAGEIRGQLS